MCRYFKYSSQVSPSLSLSVCENEAIEKATALIQKMCVCVR